MRLVRWIGPVALVLAPLVASAANKSAAPANASTIYLRHLPDGLVAPHSPADAHKLQQLGFPMPFHVLSGDVLMDRLKRTLPGYGMRLEYKPYAVDPTNTIRLRSQDWMLSPATPSDAAAIQRLGFRLPFHVLSSDVLVDRLYRYAQGSGLDVVRD
jgi:hypothetical protein